jgi:hypothetical protein
VTHQEDNRADDRSHVAARSKGRTSPALLRRTWPSVARTRTQDRIASALLVEKRMGVGWTLNMANRWSWLILGAVVSAIVISNVLR